jgi:hypothetical protein
VTIASEVSARDGLGWEFAALDGDGSWAVFREDGGDFPVFSSARGPGELPAQDDVRAMTEEAVADLLAAAGCPDEVGWITRNISSALALASVEASSRQGEEWALESDANDRATLWARPGDPRVPYAWLRACGDRPDTVVTTYQDDGVFGLSFISGLQPHPPQREAGVLRPRRRIPLITGWVNQAEVVYDTLVEGGATPGLVTEVLFHGDDRSTLLIAAEAYARDGWLLYDESVVALPGLPDADALTWLPTRQPWRSTEGAPP